MTLHLQDGDASTRIPAQVRQFNWKTEKSWGGQCRTLLLKLADGSTHTASFTFK